MTLNSPDTHWMNLALEQAKLAELAGEVPVGAVIVDNETNELISAGHNLCITQLDPTSHAEVVAIRNAGLEKNNYRLTNTTLYVTLEPCLMCYGAIVHARLSRVVFAASDPKSGVLGGADNIGQLKFLNHTPEVTAGVLSDTASDMLKKFFKNKR